MEGQMKVVLGRVSVGKGSKIGCGEGPQCTEAEEKQAVR